MLCCGLAAGLIATGALWRRLALGQRWLVGLSGLALLVVPAAAVAFPHSPIHRICGMADQ